MYNSILSLAPALEGVANSTCKFRYLLYRGKAGTWGLSGWVQKISAPPGFEPQTGQYVVSRYTDD